MDESIGRSGKRVHNTLPEAWPRRADVGLRLKPSLPQMCYTVASMNKRPNRDDWRQIGVQYHMTTPALKQQTATVMRDFAIDMAEVFAR